MFEKIIVPLDSSRFSVKAVSYAIDVAQRYNAEIILLKVLIPTTPVYPVALMEPATPAITRLAVQEAKREDKRNLRRANRYLAGKSKEISTRGVPVRYGTVMGDPAGSIIKVCRKERAGLIIMTTHGKGGLKRAIMGSVTDEVIRKSGVPVLVIRPKQRR